MDIFDKLGRGAERFGRQIVDTSLAPWRAGQRLVEAINPWDTESKGNEVINRANTSYNFTPEFKGTLDRNNPKVRGGAWQNPHGLDGKASAQYKQWDPYSTSRIQLSDNDPNTLVHEGLHAAWYDDPQNQQDFRNVLRRIEGIPFRPDAANYIRSRMQPYQNYRPDLSLADQPSLTEVHSYLPEFYMKSVNPMPPEVSGYYKRFWNNPISEILYRQEVVPRQTRAAIDDILNPRSFSRSAFDRGYGRGGAPMHLINRQEELPPLTNRYTK